MGVPASPFLLKIKGLAEVYRFGTSLVGKLSASFVGISPRHLMTFPVTWLTVAASPLTGHHGVEMEPAKL
jgi:hypothetical protein